MKRWAYHDGRPSTSVRSSWSYPLSQKQYLLRINPIIHVVILIHAGITFASHLEARRHSAIESNMPTPPICCPPPVAVAMCVRVYEMFERWVKRALSTTPSVPSPLPARWIPVTTTPRVSICCQTIKTHPISAHHPPHYWKQYWKRYLSNKYASRGLAAERPVQSTSHSH